MLQDLKCVNPYFQDVLEGRKNFEVRWNDRNYKRGDILILREWHREKGYSGREVYVAVEYILDEFEGLVKGYVVLGIAKFDYLKVTEREK
jgi:hypothetical protein